VILLDTHVLVWMVSAPAKISREAVRQIRKAQREDGCAIASFTLWELALLYQRNRLRGAGTVEASIREILEKSRVTVIELTPEIAALAMSFPDNYPRDPGDRLIGATARACAMTLITQDERILASPLIRSVW
jgi:PIN domain nuclease of toxin-antitoxin system